MTVKYYSYATTQYDTPLDVCKGEERNKQTGKADRSAKCAKCHKQGKQLWVSIPPEKAQIREDRTLIMPEKRGGRCEQSVGRLFNHFELH